MVSAKYLNVSFMQMLDIFLVKAYSMFILNICQANGLFAFFVIRLFWFFWIVLGRRKEDLDTTFLVISFKYILIITNDAFQYWKKIALPQNTFIRELI